jgi:hypothetical protein
VKLGNEPKDPVEGRGHRNTELLEGKMTGPPRPEDISTRQQRIAELARQAPGMAFTTLAHHMDMAWMQEAFRRTRKDGAPGAVGFLGAGHAEVGPFAQALPDADGRWESMEAQALRDQSIVLAYGAYHRNCPKQPLYMASRARWAVGM